MGNRLPDWFRLALRAFFGFWAAMTAFYWLGATGARVFGSTASFDRQHDFVLLEIDHERAFRVGTSGVDVVRYHRGMFPFCPLCGFYETGEQIVEFTINESCIVFNAAFLLIFAFLIVVGAILLVVSKTR